MDGLLGELGRLQDWDDDMRRMQGSLTRLPQSTAHRVMVPACKRAMLRGVVESTNEVLVHLGADFFVERSAAEACHVLERRKLRAREDIAKIQAMLHAREAEEAEAQAQAQARGRAGEEAVPTPTEQDIESMQVGPGRPVVAKDKGGFVEIREDVGDAHEAAAAAAASRAAHGEVKVGPSASGHVVGDGEDEDADLDGGSGEDLQAMLMRLSAEEQAFEASGRVVRDDDDVEADDGRMAQAPTKRVAIAPDVKGGDADDEDSSRGLHSTGPIKETVFTGRVVERDAKIGSAGAEIKKEASEDTAAPKKKRVSLFKQSLHQ